MTLDQTKYDQMLQKISSKQAFDLTGKIALITGASRGIGMAVAHLFAEFGAEVIVSSRKQESIQSVADEIIARGGKARAIACHIGDTEAVKQLMANIREQYGVLDILVNNAAANPYFGHILDTDEGALRKTIEVNL